MEKPITMEFLANFHDGPAFKGLCKMSCDSIVSEMDYQKTGINAKSKRTTHPKYTNYHYVVEIDGVEYDIHEWMLETYGCGYETAPIRLDDNDQIIN